MIVLDGECCANCLYWTKEREQSVDHAGLFLPAAGLCDAEKFRQRPLPPEQHTMSTECGENTIGTDEGFCCINWTPK